MEKTTPLYATHQAHGGKIVPFAGYLLPVQYQTGVITEHMAVRESCGLFDVSHMGEILCEGPGALKLLNHLLTNDFTNMYDGQARYSLMCYENGNCVDDLIVYKVRDEHYFIVVNAANKDKDFAWMKAHEQDVEGTTLTDISVSVDLLAQFIGPAQKDQVDHGVEKADCRGITVVHFFETFPVNEGGNDIRRFIGHRRLDQEGFFPTHIH